MTSIRVLRKQALDARRNLPAEVRMQASEIICRRVCALREFFASDTIACYLPMHDEVDPRAVISAAWRANKRTFVPVLRGRAQMVFCEIDPETEFARNRFGIVEPVRGRLVDPRRIDVVITPTVAFDENCNRIGMGSAYYDRCFAHLRNRQHWIRPRLIGVAFRCQKVEKIQPNPWDIRLYKVITE